MTLVAGCPVTPVDGLIQHETWFPQRWCHIWATQWCHCDNSDLDNGAQTDGHFWVTWWCHITRPHIQVTDWHCHLEWWPWQQNTDRHHFQVMWWCHKPRPHIQVTDWHLHDNSDLDSGTPTDGTSSVATQCWPNHTSQVCTGCIEESNLRYHWSALP